EDLGNNPPMGLAPDIRLYWDPDTDWGIGGNPTLAATYPTNEWVYSSAFVNFSTSGAKSLMIRGFNGANPEAVKLYLDNLTLAEVSLRP
ncbi:MAG: hypothetical protein AAF927_18695, partial [Bacteroidota bacterium]